MERLEKNGRENHAIPQSPIPWRYTFLFAIWVIWLKSNSWVFPNKKSHNSEAAEIRHRTLEFYLCVLSLRKPPRLIEKHIRWERPNQGWMKLNTDSSSLGNPGIAGGGGVVRNEHGKWIVGFLRKIGRTTSYVAEQWALRDGLNLCLAKDFLVVEVELDAKCVVNALSSPNQSNVNQSALLDDCRQLSTRFRLIRFNHYNREANQCADGIARKGDAQSDDFILFNSPPVDLEFSFNFDLNGKKKKKLVVGLPVCLGHWVTKIKRRNDKDKKKKTKIKKQNEINNIIYM